MNKRSYTKRLHPIRHVRRGRKGVSLTELIIASAMVGIVMLGVLSIDYAIRGSRNTAADDSLLAMQTWATVAHITKNAQHAVGNASLPGIMVDAATNYFCFRRDVTATPETYAGDHLYCYSLHSNTITTCTIIPVGNVVAVPAACQASDTVIGTYATKQSCSSDCDLFKTDVVLDDTTQEIYFELELTNRLKPTEAADPLTNPDYTVKTRVYPQGHSF